MNKVNNHREVCPNCGYCPTCGRRKMQDNTPPWPNPVTNPPWYVFYGQNTTNGSTYGNSD